MITEKAKSSVDEMFELADIVLKKIIDKVGVENKAELNEDEKLLIRAGLTIKGLSEMLKIMTTPITDEELKAFKKTDKYKEMKRKKGRIK